MRACSTALLLFASVALGIHHANCMYDDSDSVVTLTAKNFNSMVADSNLVSVVEFFAPWCGHCKALAPIFKKVAEKLEVRALFDIVL
jgi:protein disulfide-isomerase A6